MSCPFNEVNDEARPVNVSEITEGPQAQFDLAGIGVQTIISQGQGHGQDGDVLERPPVVNKDTKTHTKPKKPPMYKVLLHNDDTTPFDFVVKVLKKHFDVPPARAQSIMMAAHSEGMAVVASYAKEIAETKVDAANNYARSQENPYFQVPMELTFSCEKD